MTTFAELGVADDLVEALAAAGIDSPFPVQALTIPDGLAGRDVLGKAKTGSGKTLAFGLPLIQRITKAKPNAPAALILVPTRELANQVREVIEPLAAVRGLSTEGVYGGVSMERQVKALDRGLDICVGTPGRVIDLMDRGHLRVDSLQVLVLDEADRMVDMGFLPQVQKILFRVTSEPQTLLFSATLDGAIGRIVSRYTKDPVRHELAGGEVTVEAMTHRFLKVHEMDKAKVVAAIARESHRCLVFVRTKRGADHLLLKLRREGVHAGAIHGDLRQGSREQALKEFTAGKLDALVATDVAARGLDIDGVDVVVHYDPADDPKTYLHRSGRTARAGRSGLTVTLSLWNEENSVRMLQRRLGLQIPLVEMFSNDPRLADLVAWEPS